MKRKIAIAMEYPLMQRGGVEILIQDLLEGLAADYDLVLVSGDRNISDIPKPYRDFIVRHIPWDGRLASYATAKKLAAALKAEKVELAHFHFGGVYTWGSRLFGRCPTVACKRLGIPCPTTVHLVQPVLEGFCGPLKPLWFKLALWPGAWLSRLHVLLQSSGEIAVSDHDLKTMQRWFFPWKNRIRRIYHSILKLENERWGGSGPREPIILSVGTIAPRKGQLYLARAFIQIAKDHPEWKLVLAGREAGDAYIAKMKEEITQAGLDDRVIWTGPLDRSEVEALMLRASVFALPSLEEGLGLSLQEALYRGCPAVGSNIGGIPELIEHETNGLLVPPGDVDKLAAALKILLSDDALRKKLATEARPSILRKEMTHSQMVENYRRLYESHINQ